MRPQGSPAELDRRRLRAIGLLQRAVPVHPWPTASASIPARLVTGSGRTDDKAAPACAHAPRPLDPQAHDRAATPTPAPGHRRPGGCRVPHELVDVPPDRRSVSSTIPITSVERKHTAVCCLPGMNSSNNLKPLHG